MMSGDYELLLRVARRHGRARAGGGREPHAAVLDALGTEYLILPGAPVGKRRLGGLDNVVLLRNPPALPRARIVHKIRTLPPLQQSDPASVARRTEEVLFPGGKVRDLRHEAVVEAARAPDKLPTWSGGPAPAIESCRIVDSGPQRVEIRAGLTRPGLVVLSDLYYPGWQVEVATEGVQQSHRPPILRTDRAFRGVYLPAGRHRLCYRYRPRTFFVGAAAGGIGWLALGLAALIAGRRRRLGFATWLLRGPRSCSARRCG